MKRLVWMRSNKGDPWPQLWEGGIDWTIAYHNNKPDPFIAPRVLKVIKLDDNDTRTLDELIKAYPAPEQDFNG